MWARGVLGTFPAQPCGSHAHGTRASSLEAIIAGIVLSVRSQLVLAPQPRSASVARAWVADTLGEWKCDALVDSVKLVVSELVGNVVRHAPSPLELTLSLDAARLRVSVTDSGPGRVEPARPSTLESGGRGLTLVERVSDRWGVDYAAKGKTVWAEWGRDDGPLPR